MTDVNVTRLDVIEALRSRIIETVDNTQKLGYPPNPEDIFDRVCGFVSGPVSGQVPIETALPAEVCERMRRDGGSVFPAHANTGDQMVR